MRWLIGLWRDEEGLGTLEILLIVAVLIAVALAFRQYIIKWVKSLLGKMDQNINTDLPSFDSPAERP